MLFDPIVDMVPIAIIIFQVISMLASMAKGAVEPFFIVVLFVPEPEEESAVAAFGTEVLHSDQLSAISYK